MKTKILVVLIVMLYVGSLKLTGQNYNEATKEESPAYYFEIPDDPKLTQADIEMLMEAAKGAPANAEPVKDDRAFSEEALQSEGVYYLAPANAEPIDDEAEYQRSLLHHQEVMATETPSEAGRLMDQTRQTVPELIAPKRELMKPDGNHIQPPGEIAPKREKSLPEATSPQRAQQSPE